MNPYIKSLGLMDIMSGSEEKTPTVSPDQGATGETTTSSENKEAGMQTVKVAEFPKLSSNMVVTSVIYDLYI